MSKKQKTSNYDIANLASSVKYFQEQLDNLVYELDTSTEYPEPSVVRFCLEKISENNQELDSIVTGMNEYQTRSDNLNALANYYSEKASDNKNKAMLLKNALKKCLEILNTSEISTDLFKISVVNSGGVVGMDVDIDSLPDEYKETITTTSIKADSIKLREDLEQGKQISGAKLLPRTKLLKIK